jgi:hypothetical protein
MQSKIEPANLGGFDDPSQTYVPMNQLSAGLPHEDVNIPYNPQPDANTQVADQQTVQPGYQQPAPGAPQLPSWQPSPDILQGMQHMVLHPDPKVRISMMQQLLPQVQQSITQYVNNMFAPNPMASTSTNSNMFQPSQQSQPPVLPPTLPQQSLGTPNPYLPNAS